MSTEQLDSATASEAREAILEALEGAGLDSVDHDRRWVMWPATVYGVDPVTGRKVFVTWSPGGIRIGVDARAGDDTIHLRGAATRREVLTAVIDALANAVTR